MAPLDAYPAHLCHRLPSDRVAIISYDEKPGIQAIATTSPDGLLMQSRA
jgi:hypothetical protein